MNLVASLLPLLKENLSKAEARLEVLSAYALKNNMHSRAEELKQKEEDPKLWDNPAEASKLLQEQTSIRKFLDEFSLYRAAINNAIEVLPELEAEEELLQELFDDSEKTLYRLEKMYLRTLFSGRYDGSDCFITVTAGSGGLEAQDWASMLFSMYEGFAKQNGDTYSYQVIDYSDAEVGIKSATIRLCGGEGSFPYGNLRGESGVHRLVRKSPFNANNNRHTSFASVLVAPVIEQGIELQISELDLKIDTYRASGAGGQHVNKTDSAVRITHLPTGIVVQSQNDRSQHRNKAEAMKMLQSRLYTLAEEQKKKEIEAAGPEKGSISWGNQIRSYVLDDSRVKDLRTGVESRQPEQVLAGDILQFLEAYIKWQAS